MNRLSSSVPSTESLDDLLPALGPEQLQALNICLSPDELEKGCQVYKVPTNAFAPHLPVGSYAVVQPLTVPQWCTLQPSDYCLVTAEYVAEGGDPAYMVHHFVRIASNGLRAGRPLWGIVADPHSTPTPEPFQPESHAEQDPNRHLRAVAQVVKVITLFL